MKVAYPYLNDHAFLDQLFSQQVREHFIRIFVLDWIDETPMAEIQGLITSGTLNINGSSAIRRTCSLTMSVSEQAITTTNDGYIQVEKLLGYNKKVFLEIGIKNFTSEYIDYPIVWYPLETQILTGASFTHNTQGVIVNLQLKDKMCLLNGLIGGILPACVDFAQYDTLDRNGNTTTVKVPVIQIIRELLNHFGNEAEERIVISDIPKMGKQVVQFSPEMTTGENMSFYLWQGNEIPTGVVPKFEKPTEIIAGLYANANKLCPYTKFYGVEGLKNHIFNYSFSPENYIGYSYTDFVYPGELTTNYNNSVCDVLDKIKQVFSNQEQFQKNDTFYFQEKQNYLNQRDIYNTFNIGKIEENSQQTPAFNSGQDISSLSSYILPINPKSQYSFDNSNIVIAYSNTPKYENIKNDFIVWGSRKNGSNKNAIRYHLAIDERPKFGNQYLVAKGRVAEDGTLLSDWDNSYISAVNFIIAENSSSEDINELPFPGLVGVTYALIRGIEGTDRKEIITEALWEINGGNNPTQEGTTMTSPEGVDVNKIENSHMTLYYWDPSAATVQGAYVKYPDGSGRLKVVTTNDWRDEIYLSGLYSDITGTATSYYYTEIKAEWAKIYNSWTGDFLKSFKENPGTCDWYLDIIESNEFKDISVPMIGRRSKVVQDASVNCVFESVIPDFCYINCGPKTLYTNTGDNLNEEAPMLNLNGQFLTEESKPDIATNPKPTMLLKNDVEQFFKKELAIKTMSSPDKIKYKGSLEEGQKIIEQRDLANENHLIPIGVTADIGDYIHIAPAQNSALYAVRELLTEYTSLQNTITIECLPIYYLEPNTRITVNDPVSQISGDFIIDTIACPLSVNGNMTITASKINEKI